MRLPVYVADAFSSEPFTGNPAAVVPLDHWIEDDIMQAIAEQHNLAETAFVVVHPDENGMRPLRWFTPAKEVRLCGHATLATAFVLRDVLRFKDEVLRFSTLSGELICAPSDGKWSIQFPADIARPAPQYADLASKIVDATSIDSIHEGIDDLLVILKSSEQVREYVANDSAIRRLDKRGVILSAADDSGEYDIVSRCFYPEYGVDEDSVTGSAHTLLGPYWSKRLRKEVVECFQASRRGGRVTVEYSGAEHVRLLGHARLYLHGELKF